LNATELLLGDEPLARHGARIALLSGEEQVTYAELAARMKRTAGALASFGVGAGDRVLLLMRDTAEFAATWLGAVRIGAVAIALNNRLSEAECRHVLHDSSARLVIVEDLFADARPQLAAELARDGRLALSWRERCGESKEARVFDALPDTPAFGLYTSGTTGHPKGILHSHRGFLSLGQAFREIGIGAGDRVFTTSKLFFAYGLEHALLGTLALGATSILFADWPDTEAVIDVVGRHRPAALFSVPTVYRRLLGEPSVRLAAFRSVRRFVAGGERLSSQLVEHWKQAVGGELLNLYGMSETFCACMMTPPGTSDGTRTGRPLAGVEVRLDRQGVLWVKHPAQASGYANPSDQTQEQFRDGWFCSRDVFVQDADGFFAHQGRSDELVKIAGQWVQPGELEAAAALEPAIAEAACVLVPDADGLDRLALFVTARGDAAEALRAAAQACELRLPRHKRPRWVRAVAELPRTATGKVQRFKLREILQRELARKD
jgi:acyl-coenzyme A synthetase/AMP-(fatty) acid ligase